MATSFTSASVASHNAEIELIDETRWAKNALAVNLDNSLLQRFVVNNRSRGTQCAYTSTSAWIAASDSPPIRTRSGDSKSSTAVPSARNSGLLSTSKVAPEEDPPRIALTASAVRTGKVDFSTTIL